MHTLRLVGGWAALTCLLMACVVFTSPLNETWDNLVDSGASQKVSKDRGTFSGEGKRKEKNFELECLAAHNKWRRIHGSPDLVLDRKIIKQSQKNANRLAATKRFEHTVNSPYGENLYMQTGNNRDKIPDCTKMIGTFYNEIKLYSFNSPGFADGTGHFTQLIWSDTKRLGCARAYSQDGWIYLACNYDPPGNANSGEYFRNNVKPSQFNWMLEGE